MVGSAVKAQRPPHPVNRPRTDPRVREEVRHVVSIVAALEQVRGEGIDAFLAAEHGVGDDLPLERNDGDVQIIELADADGIAPARPVVTDINDAIDIAQRTETTLFAISTKAGLSGSVPGVEAGQAKDKGDKDLDRLCEETGGAAFFTGDMLSLERSFSKIARELRSQYLITYRPANDRYDGSYRRVDVKLTNGHENLRLRTKKGYKAVADSVTPK